nr:ORF 4 [African cassava mosaic virus]
MEVHITPYGKCELGLILLLITESSVPNGNNNRTLCIKGHLIPVLNDYMVYLHAFAHDTYPCSLKGRRKLKCNRRFIIRQFVFCSCGVNIIAGYDRYRCIHVQHFEYKLVKGTTPVS